MYWTSSSAAAAAVAFALLQLFPAPITGQQDCSNVEGTSSVSPIFALGPSNVQYTSCASGFDGPKVNPINLTTYDWWYFDAVSDDGLESLVVIYFTSSSLGFLFDLGSVAAATSVTVFATFADGTSGFWFLTATGADITTAGDGASGEWKSIGLSFDGAEDLSTYKLSFTNPLSGITGTFDLESHGPGHFACSPLQEGADMHIVPNVGWVNVLPAATGTVDVNIFGKPLQFSGPAYHDKNWGDIPFTSAVSSWYWGHGHIGPYYLVWFDAIDSAGEEHVSGYAIENNEAVGATCSTLRVRPVDSVYPPTLLSDPEQFTITMLLNDGENVTVTVTAERTQINVASYVRWIGTIEGTIGSVSYNGSALWEQFAFELL